jgi:hypothetical protein
MATSFKCTDEAKTHIPEDMKERLRQKARQAGCDFSEYLRDLIYMAEEGLTFGEHVANHRRAVLGGKGQGVGQIKPADSSVFSS